MISVNQIRLFLNTLDKYIDFIEHNFPRMKDDIIVFRDFVNVIKVANPQLMMTQYNKYVGKFRKEIEVYNDDFFLNLAETHFESEFMYDLFKKIREIWLDADITDKKKATVWFYIKTLLMASEDTQNVTVYRVFFLIIDLDA